MLLARIYTYINSFCIHSNKFHPSYNSNHKYYQLRYYTKLLTDNNRKRSHSFSDDILGGFPSHLAQRGRTTTLDPKANDVKS